MQKTACGVLNKGKYLRKAHAVEIFRSSFYEAKKSETTVSCLDLDQLILSERVRPSLLTKAFEVSGAGLAVVSKVTPARYSNMIASIIDDVAIHQFNDIIRDIKNEEISRRCTTNFDNDDNSNQNLNLNPNLDDIKETIKFHRMIRNSPESSSSGTANEETAKTMNFTSLNMKDVMDTVLNPKTLLTVAISSALNLTSTV